MPTVLRENGFSFIVYINDHEPMHVHIFYQGREAVINFADGLKIRDNFGLNRSQMRRALSITQQNRQLLKEKWSEINEKQ